MIGVLGSLCGRGGIGIHNRLKFKLSASSETLGVEPLKVGETFKMAIPNEVPQGKRVET